MVFAFTGTGRVANGVEEILELLPHIKVAPDELVHYMKGGKKHADAENKIIISQFEAKDLVEHKEGKEFVKSEYYKKPSKF